MFVADCDFVNNERGGCPCCALATAKGVQNRGKNVLSRVDQQQF